MANSETESENVCVTIFLKDTQERTLDQMIGGLRDNGFFEKFPPDGVTVLSWYQLMGFGHVVTLDVPPGKVRDINHVLESCAYGTFKVDVHLGYDFWPTMEGIKAKAGQ